MNNQVFKREVLKALQDRGEWFQEVNSIQYRTRCPYCGDSSNPNTGHFYIKINPDDNSNIVYMCFKCSSHGVMTGETLSLLGIQDSNLLSGISDLNKTSDRYDRKGISTDIKPMFFDFKIPETQSHKNKIQYIENRLGLRFSNKMIDESKLITSLKDFLVFNNLDQSDYKKSIINFLDKNYIGFLSYGNSHIFFRDITEKQELSWIKFPITKESFRNKAFYAMRTNPIDIMSVDPITINLTEGIMDILSVSYNLGYNDGMNMNIAVGGKYYEKIIFMLIDMGFIGSNVHINLFSDNDKVYNKKANNKDTEIENYRKIFQYYKFLFGSFTIYYNTLYKDCGTTRDKIMLRKERL